MSVRDQCGWVGGNFTSPLIPVAPRGLSTLSFSSYFNIAYGATTGAFDPALPRSCWTYGAADPIITTPMVASSATPGRTTTNNVAWATPVSSASPGNLGFTGAVTPTSHTLKTSTVVDPPAGETNAAAEHSADPETRPKASHGVADEAGNPQAKSPPAFDSPSKTKTAQADPSKVSFVTENESSSDETARPTSQIPGLVSGSFPSAVAHGSNTGLDNGQRRVPNAIAIGATTHEIESPAIYTINDQTLAAGGPPITVNNIQYSLDKFATALVSGTNTIGLQSPPIKPPIVGVGETTYMATQASVYIIDGQTLRPNGPAIVINGASFSLASGASALVFNGITTPLSFASPTPPILDINGQTYRADTRPRLQIGSVAVVAGGAPVTIDGSRYSLASSGTAFVVGSSTILAGDGGQPGGKGHRSGSSPAPADISIPLVIGSKTTFLNPSKELQTGDASPSAFVIIASQTLRPGGQPITISGIPYSLAPLTTLPSAVPTSTPPAGLAVLTVASQTYTCHQNANCTIAAQILSPNGSITVSGDTVKYGSTGIDIIQAPKTQDPQRGEVITTHIDGLTPLQTIAAATTTTKKSESGIGKSRVGGCWLIGVLSAVIIVWMIG
ncbi:MAG: hypothetical protein Q9179_004845 [Wetmoreana sp. 5 TL-2023]